LHDGPVFKGDANGFDGVRIEGTILKAGKRSWKGFRKSGPPNTRNSNWNVHQYQAESSGSELNRPLRLLQDAIKELELIFLDLTTVGKNPSQ